MKQHALPLSLHLVKMVRASQCARYLAGIVDIHAGLERELLGQNRILRTMIVAETEVVRTAERQLGLQLATDVLILRCANLVDNTCHLVAAGDVNKLFELALEHLPLRGANQTVHSNNTFYRHITLGLKI